MNRRFIVSVFLLFIASCSHIQSVEFKVSNYQIVLPDKGKDTYFDSILEKAAMLLRDCVKKSTGVAIPITRESQLKNDKSSIFIGDTRESRKAKVNVTSFVAWEYLIKNNGKDIFLTGKDFTVLPKGRHYKQYSLGTVKAVTTFLEKFCGTHFLLPGPNGIVVDKQKRPSRARQKAVPNFVRSSLRGRQTNRLGTGEKIAFDDQQKSLWIPENLNIRKKTRFQYCTSRDKELFYDIANNFFPAVDYGNYGGHSHDAAIPYKKYYKTHPEYFTYDKSKNKRFCYPTKPQYCFSNPEVRELIYKELLKKLDEGYQYAQLGHADGFKKCDCEKCATLYGVEDFGEKIWIMHRDMAKRLLKDRPGKKVVILAYGPTKNPPRTFKDFPSNVSVELCGNSAEFFDKWKNHHVPSGFTTYIYNWGYFHKEGFTPKSATPEFCQEQVELFAKNNVWGIYRCGFGEIFGLEGPVYYLYGKLLEDPSLEREKVLDEYCDLAFGNSAEPMNNFFELLFKRMAVKPDNNVEDDWNDRDLLLGKVPQLHINLEILELRYPHEIVEKLEEYLSQAEKIATPKEEKLRIDLTRKEFDYMKKTSKIAEVFDKYRKSPSKQCLDQLLYAIDDRRKFIASLPVTHNNRLESLNDFPIFGNNEVSTLEKGGRMKSEYKTPFDWDTNLIRKIEAVPGNRSIYAPKATKPIKIDGEANEGVWKKAKPQTLLRLYMDREVKFVETTVRVAFDDSALYALFQFPVANAGNLKKNSFFAFLSPDKSQKNLCRINFRATTGYATVFKRIESDKANHQEEYEPIKLKDRITVAFKTDEKTNTITGEVEIPFSLYPSKPEPGSTWYGNFTRRIIDAKDGKRFTDYIWEPNVNWKTWCDRYAVMGKIIFE